MNTRILERLLTLKNNIYPQQQTIIIHYKWLFKKNKNVDFFDITINNKTYRTTYTTSFPEPTLTQAQNTINQELTNLKKTLPHLANTNITFTYLYNNQKLNSTYSLEHTP